MKLRGRIKQLTVREKGERRHNGGGVGVGEVLSGYVTHGKRRVQPRGWKKAAGGGV